MGYYYSKLSNIIECFTSHPARAIMLGLDAAGKTTVLYKMKLKETFPTIPTIGFNVETLSPYKGLTLTVWDVGGQDSIRKFWNYYYNNTSGLIFVVDSCDRDRFDEARRELHNITQEEEMLNVPVLVLANKQDKPRAASVIEIKNALQMKKLKSDWIVRGCCALNGQGLSEAFENLSEMMMNFINES